MSVETNTVCCWSQYGTLRPQSPKECLEKIWSSIWWKEHLDDHIAEVETDGRMDCEVHRMFIGNVKQLKLMNIRQNPAQTEVFRMICTDLWLEHWKRASRSYKYFTIKSIKQDIVKKCDGCQQECSLGPTYKLLHVPKFLFCFELLFNIMFSGCPSSRASVWGISMMSERESIQMGSRSHQGQMSERVVKKRCYLRVHVSKLKICGGFFTT